MKAYLNHVICSACNHAMLFDRSNEYIVKCTNSECELFGIEYHAPSVELEPVDKPSIVEYVIIHEET